MVTKCKKYIYNPMLCVILILLRYRGGDFIYQKMLKESRRLEEQTKGLKNLIENLPTGKLISGSNGKYQQWFRSDGHVRTYISKKEKELIEKYFDIETDAGAIKLQFGV